MRKDYLISVIMGVHNSSKDKCIRAVQSIEKQTYKNWEFIICDDGSTNDTLIFLKEIAKKDKRVKLLSTEKNHGLAFALNQCIKNANGEFIARMDDDDISLPDRLELELNFLTSHKEYSFVSTNFILESSNGEHIKKMKRVPTKNDFLWSSPFLHPATMFRKEDLIKVNGYRVANETRRAEDYDLFMRMYIAGMKGYNIQRSLYKYYIGESEVKKKSKYIYRIYEAHIRFVNFKRLDLPFVKVVMFSIKPLIVGALPKSVVYLIRMRNK